MKHDYKAALEEVEEMLRLDKKTGINNPDIADGRVKFLAIQSALRIAEMLQSGEVSDGMIDIAYKRAGLDSGYSHHESYRKLAQQLLKEIESE